MGFSNQSLWSSTLHYHASHPHFTTPLFSSHHPTQEIEEIKEIKVGVEEKKKTQGMRRDLGHKGCGLVTQEIG